MELEIKCYLKNKLIYRIELAISKGRLLKQIKQNKIIYMSRKTGGTEIIYLDKFDKVEFNTNLEVWEEFYEQ